MAIEIAFAHKLMYNAVLVCHFDIAGEGPFVLYTHETSVSHTFFDSQRVTSSETYCILW